MIPLAVVLITALVLAMPPLAGWFSATMPRHQLLQVPAMLLLGVLAVRSARRRGLRLPDTHNWDPALLVLAVGAMLFWMIPRSLDIASTNAVADQLLHVSWFLIGAIAANSLPRVSFIVGVALAIHALAMLIMLGVVYQRYPGLICTAYTMEQQRYTGRILLYAAPILGAILWTWLIVRFFRAQTASGTIATTASPPETATGPALVLKHERA